VYLAFARDEQEVRQKYEGRVFELAVALGLGVLCFDAANRQFKEIQSPRIIIPEGQNVEEVISNCSRLFADTLSVARTSHRQAFWATMR
jgi:hypothetical protein